MAVMGDRLVSLMPLTAVTDGLSAYTTGEQFLAKPVAATVFSLAGPTPVWLDWP